MPLRPRIQGWRYPRAGFIAGPEPGSGTNADEWHLEFTRYAPGTDLMPQSARGIVVARRGVAESVELDDGLGLLTVDPPADAGTNEHFVLLPTQYNSAHNDEWLSSTRLYTRVLSTGRILIEWARCTDDDFGAYVLYWDEGDAGDTDVELVTLSERNVTQYLTDAQAAGTYQFRLELQDDIGNETTENDEYSVTVYLEPDAVTISESSWSVANEQLTLTLDTSSEVWVFANWLRGYGFCDYVVWETGPLNSQPFEIKRSGSATHVTRTLWEGNWRIAVAGRSRYWQTGPADYLNFTLARDGNGDLQYISELQAPRDVWVEPLVGGDLRIHWEWLGSTGATLYAELWAMDDGDAAYALETTQASTASSYDSSAGTNGTERTYKIRAKYNDGAGLVAYGPYSATAAATPDATAPTGTHTLTVTAQ